MSKPLTCLRCGGTTERGWIPDLGEGTRPMIWGAGEPIVNRSFFGIEAGVHYPEKGYHVVAYRCAECGYLELYAKEPNSAPPDQAP